MSWSNQLEIASFAGVEFQCQSTEDSIDRRLAEHEYPWKDGADIEDMGRRARRTRITAVFVGAEYETELGAFLKVADGGKVGRFIHPLLGSWNAYVASAPIKHEHSSRDMATVDVEFVEDGTLTALPDLFTIEKAQDEVLQFAAEVLTLTPAPTSKLQQAVADARQFAADAKDNIKTVVSKLNQVRKKIDEAINEIDSALNFQNYPAVRALRRLAWSCKKLSDRTQKVKPTIVAKNIPAALPFSMLAHKQYGDHRRADELAALNKVRNPFLVKRGTSLRVYGS